MISDRFRRAVPAALLSLAFLPSVWPAHAATAARCVNGDVPARVAAVKNAPCNVSVYRPAALGGAPPATGFVKSPQSPAVKVYYDPDGQPRQFSTAEVESVIRGAATAWSKHCNVRLSYGGIAAKGRRTQSVIRWAGELANVRHNGTRIAAMGSMSGDVKLNPAISSALLKRTITHEIGHVIGVGHIHEDPTAVMSYTADYKTRVTSVLSESDYLSCNEAIRIRFGIRYRKPADVKVATMSDGEAVGLRFVPLSHEAPWNGQWPQATEAADNTMEPGPVRRSAGSTPPPAD